VIGDDGTGSMWQRLSRDGLQMLAMASLEARELGHPCTADEHLLLGILRHGTNPTAALLRELGLDLTTARTALLEVGPTLGPRTDPSGALRSVGIDVDQVRQRLEATFGTDAVRAAERRVRRRPRWRGDIPAPAHCAGTFSPSARTTSRSSAPTIAVTPRSGRTTCSTARYATPRTPSAPS
jgi:hypothetical protein